MGEFDAQMPISLRLSRHWRAGCGESCKSGSGRGGWKRSRWPPRWPPTPLGRSDRNAQGWGCKRCPPAPRNRPVARRRPRQDPQGHAAAQRDRLGLVDHAHAAPQPKPLKMAEVLAGVSTARDRGTGAPRRTSALGHGRSGPGRRARRSSWSRAIGIVAAASPLLQKLSLPRPRAWITPRSIQPRPRPRCGSIPGRAIGQGFASLSGTCTACQMLWSASSCTSATTARSSRSIAGSGFGKAPRARGLLGYWSR